MSSPRTVRLDHEDAHRLTFDARVIAHAQFNGAPSVVLDQSAFYPESGGQLGDQGTLAGVRVRDVQIDDDGRVHHVVDGALPALESTVQGSIDAARRRQHRAIHTAQHMLSRALLDEARAETVSSRLGEDGCTIDLDVPSLDEKLLARAEALVNSVIDDDVAVRAYFPSAEELAGLPLRRAPKVTQNVRVVSVGDFDVSPCGGTHCTRTSQIGTARVTGTERYKGKVRVSFDAGPRVRALLHRESDALRALAKDFTCGPLAVEAAVEKLRREWGATREALGKSTERLATLTADALPDREGLVVGSFDGASVEFLRAVAGRVAETRPASASLLAAPGPEGVAVLCARGAESKLDCGALLKKAAAHAGGRGGGKPERAEGRLPPGTDWLAVLAAVGTT